MAIQTFSWQRKTTAWDDMQAWHTRMQTARDDTLANNDIFSSAFTDAQNNLATGLATLAAKALLARIQNEAKAKALAKSQVDMTV